MSKTKRKPGKAERAAALVREALAIEVRCDGLVTVNAAEIANRAGCSRILVQLTVKAARVMGMGSPKSDRSRAPNSTRNP